GSRYVHEYEYDENGNVIKETYTDAEGNVTVTEYDENGNPAQ
ncbi:MAG: RHS repeat protein, partial [Clostridia bacterium]|nr:RHS repeat protein [Clostridia bacterium]